MHDADPQLSTLSPAKRALLERRLEEKKKAKRAAIPVARPEGPLPLSFAQERLWFMTQLDPRSAVYSIPFALRFRGELNRGALQQALDEILRRHEALRTRFLAVNAEPAQVIDPFSQIAMPVVDLSGLPEQERETSAMRRCEEESQRQFDLERDGMLRATLIRLEETENILFLNMHHIASDNWSLGILVRELGALYCAFCAGSPSPLSELPVQYADYALWQRKVLEGEVLEKQLAYWRKQLEGAPLLLDLPADRPRPQTLSSRGAMISLALPAALSLGLRELSRREGVTLFMTLQTAFHMLLHRYTGRKDILVGSAVAGRSRTETESMIGFFVNTIVLRGDLSGNPSYRDLIPKIREVSMRGWAHAELPFERLVRELNPQRDMSHAPIVQVMFVMKTSAGEAVNLPGLRVAPPIIIDNGTSELDLTLYVEEEGESLKADLQYSTDLFEAATIRRLLNHFQNLLEAIVANPDEGIATLALLSGDERQQLLSGWNRTEKGYPVDRSVVELFEEQARKSPEKAAVVFDGRELTYGELNRRANQLARLLEKRGVAPEVLAGLCLERSPEMLIGLLGVLKAGGAYVPLDPALPRERLSFLLDDTEAPLVLTQRSLMPALPIEESRALCLDEFNWAAGPENDPARKAAPGNLAYVIYTSGSTGQPKGVMIEHLALTNYTSAAAEYYGITSDDRVLQFASINFDASLEEICCTLTRGATLYLRTEEMIASMETFVTKCREWKLSVVSLPTAFWHELVNHLEAKAVEWPESVRLVIIGGERALPERVAQWKKNTRTVLINSYGPTEATVVSTVWTASGEIGARNVPIGRPLANVETYILDQNLQPVPIGVAGELHIGGAGLARGYLKRPELTAEKFIPHPFSSEPAARLYRTGDLARYLPDGNIEFVGRVDSQVKIRGFRIELGEIETALQKHPLVRHAAIVARTEANAPHPLVGYLVPHSDGRATIGELREFLSNLLPAYMIPSVFVWIEALPLTPNGKIDERALPEPAIDSEPTLEYASPQISVQSQLIEIWEEVLHRRPIGIRDDFFALGGHSLLVARMLAMVEDRLGVRLPFGPFFAEATIERMAVLMMDRQLLQAAQQSWVVLNENGSKAPFFFLHGDFNGGGFFCRTLARQAGEDRPFYALHPAGLHGDPIPATIEEMAALKLQDLRKIQPEGPYLLGGYCNGALVAFEMARQIEAEGGSVPIVILLLANGTNVRWRQLERVAGLTSTFLFEDAVARQQRFLRWKEKSCFWRGVRIHYAKAAVDLIRQPPREQARRLVRKTQRIFRRLLGKAPPATAPATIIPNGQIPEAASDEARVWAYKIPIDSYVPKRFGGRIILLWPRDTKRVPPQGPTTGWTEVCKDIRLVLVPGEYDTCVERDPHLRVIGEEIGRALAEIEAST